MGHGAHNMQASILEEVNKLEQIIQGLAFRSTASTLRGGSHATQEQDESCKVADCQSYRKVCKQCKRVLSPKELQ